MRFAKLFTWISLSCAVLASCVTLAWRGAFPESAPPAPFNAALAEARGWSAVTLVLAVPIGVAAMQRAGRSIRARVGWLGVLAYLVYTYLEMAVSPPFTPLYLVYITAFATALCASVVVARSIEEGDAARELRFVARRTIAGFSIVFAAFLALAWLKEIGARSIASEFGWPSGENAIGHVVHALDLGLLVPLGIAAGVLLLRRHAMGWILAGVNLVVAVCMGAAVASMVFLDAVGRGASTLVAAPFLVAWLAWLGLAVRFFYGPPIAGRIPKPA